MFKDIYQKRYRTVLAIALILASGAAIFIGWNDFVIRSFGVLGCMASAYFFRTSRVKGRSDEAVENGIGTSHGTTGGPSRLLWVLSGVCALAIVGSFAYLYKDALDGYHEVLPVYVFSGTAVAGTLVWSYLAAKLSR
jgi:hypothetical protein